MPLIKSTSAKAFKQNIKTEVAAGKPLRQSVAIAYNTKREAGHSANTGKRTGAAHRIERAGILRKHSRSHGY